MVAGFQTIPKKAGWLAPLAFTNIHLIEARGGI